MEKKKTILIVDDSELIRKILHDSLINEYDLIEVKDGLECMEVVHSRSVQLSAILLNIVMPRMDGFQVISQLRRVGLIKTIPVIIVTAEESEKYISLAYDLGVSEVIQKPFNNNIIRKRIANLIELYDRNQKLEQTVSLQLESIRAQTEKLRASTNSMIDTLSTVIEYRSLESGEHVKRIRGFTKALLECIAKQYPVYRLTADEIDMISSAAVVHDIGKIAIPDAVLLKPEPLTREEFEIMKTHTTKGCEILYRIHGIDNEQYMMYCHEICLYHHERYDGAGYPDGLTGDNIPVTAQAVSICDAYDALTHTRVYKEAYSSGKARDMILRGECGTFSPQILSCFRMVLPEFEKILNTYKDEIYDVIK